ncbi:solute carrier family 22 member 21-like isoform X2 [Bacillus rossius redtenbacheri]|uniref:solute carrier family 22 member 21-like isoform X2 n=1 Tax=Bacillus rossius redtenbacheri TaxID=93214 RepID=UPI002FDD1883
MEDNEEALFDGVMREVGMAGRFQRRFNLVFNLVLVVFATMSNLNLVFAMAVPAHWCHVPGRERANLTLHQWKSITLPRENNSRGVETFDNCNMYNWSEPITEELLNRSKEDVEIIGCRDGWDYDRTWYTSTAPSQQSWVCDRELRVTNTFVASQAGDLVGSFVFGQLGDIIGRRPVFLITLSLLVVGRSMATVAAGVYPLFLATCFLGTVATNSICVSCVAVGMEISARDQSSHIAILQCLGWTAGLCLMPMIAWATGDWKSFLLISSLPCSVFFLTVWMFPESPRWLAARGRTRECLRQLRGIARVNGTAVPESAAEVLRKLGEDKETSYGFASLFSSWTLARNTFLVMLCWLINMLSYYTLTLNVTNMSGNPFLNFFWQALVELPGYLAGRALSDRYGRRWTQSAGFAAIVVGCVGLVVTSIDPTLEWLTTTMVVFVKFCFTVTNYVIYLQGIEIYPTCIRQSGTSVGTLVSTSLGMVSPYIVYLGSTTDVRLPYLILGCMALLGAGAAAFLPETLGVKLPETLHDAQRFGVDQRFWSLGRPAPAAPGCRSRKQQQQQQQRSEL